MDAGGSQVGITTRWAGRSRMVAAVVGVVLAGLLATACQSTSSTVVADDLDTPEATATPASADESEPTTMPATPDTDPTTATTAPTATSAPSTDTEPTPAPTRAPFPAAPVTLDYVLAFSPDGAFAYESLGQPWEDPRDCDDAPSPSLIGIDIARSVDLEVVGFAAGLETVGHVQWLLIDDSGAGVALDVCGDYPDTVDRLTPVMLQPDGLVAATGDSVAITDDEGVQYTYLYALEQPGIGLAEVAIGVYDDYENWVRELRRYDLNTGEFEVVEVLADDDERRLTTATATTPDGRFTYTEIDDPYGDVGCEGFGVASTLAVDDGSGSGPQPVWGSDQPAYSGIFDLHFGPDGLIAWSTGCEGYVSGYVGRILDDGSIVDHHWIDGYSAGDDFYTDYRAYRLTADGDLVALGQRFDDDYEEAEPVVRRIELDTDPQFVNTGSLTPWIDTENPLAETLAGTGQWYVGEDLSAAAGCGARTLYASTTAGYVRGVVDGESLDAIVDLAVGDRRTVDYGDGYSFETRPIAVLTECPAQYEGRRLWFANEGDVPGYGIYFEQADLPPLADLIGLREEPVNDDPYFHDLYAEVVYPDGTVTEVLLEAVPYDG